MANSTKTVCSTVGPFIHYGSTLVGVCALSGTNYVDSTGEIAWVRHMINYMITMQLKMELKLWVAAVLIVYHMI